MKQYKLIEGKNRHEIGVWSLFQTHYADGKEMAEKVCVKSWYHTPPTEEEQAHEIELNDWSRCVGELTEGQKVEISEAIYYDLLSAVPPINMRNNYFEVGEAHHHTIEGKPIHRACWVEDGKYYTGYPL